MKIIPLCLFFIYIHFFGFGQMIKGKVVDEHIQKEIPFAAIYFSGTSYGTITDEDGCFKVDIYGYKMNPLTFSAIGYFSKTIENLHQEKELLVHLAPKIYHTKEASISLKSLKRQRRRNMKIFKREIFGFSDNVNYCKIMNEQDITFNYFESDDTLKAYVSKPVIIKNKALGYTIHFYMDKFAYDKKGKFVNYDGNVKFEEDTTDIPEFIVENRKKSYKGSRMHFFRSLLNNNLDANLFSIEDEKGNQLTYEKIVIQDKQNNKYLLYKGKLQLIYYGFETELTLPKEKVYFYKNGYHYPVDIRWDVFMANKRLADWIPLEYSMNR